MGGSGEELGGVEGRETVIGIYCMKKGSIFNKRQKIKNLTSISTMARSSLWGV